MAPLCYSSRIVPFDLGGRSGSCPPRASTLRHSEARRRRNRAHASQNRTSAADASVRRPARHQVLQMPIVVQRLGQDGDHEPPPVGDLHPVRQEEAREVIRASNRVGSRIVARLGGTYGGGHREPSANGRAGSLRTATTQAHPSKPALTGGSLDWRCFGSGRVDWRCFGSGRVLARQSEVQS